MKQRYDFGYFFMEGFRSIFTHGLMSFAAVCMIVCCLLIMGSFTLVAVNASNMFSDLEKENQFTAYIEDTLTQDQARALQSDIEAIPNVARAEFVTKEEAQEEFEADYEGNPLFEGLPSEVYRDRFHIYLDDISKLPETEAAVGEITGVAWTKSAPEIAEGFNRHPQRGGGGGGDPGDHPAGGESVYHRQYHQAGHLQPPGGNRHHEDVRRHQLLCPLALRV